MCVCSQFYRGALYCLRETPKPYADVESGGLNDGNLNVNDNNNNDNNDDDDDDDDDNMETETPSTPTPLLFTGIARSVNAGHHRLGSFKLEGNKHNFRKFSLR